MKHLGLRPAILFGAQFFLAPVVRAEPRIPSGEFLFFPFVLFISLPVLIPVVACVFAVAWSLVLLVVILTNLHVQIRSSTLGKIVGGVLGVTLLLWLKQGTDHLHKLDVPILRLFRNGYALDVICVFLTLLTLILLGYACLASPRKIR